MDTTTPPFGIIDPLSARPESASMGESPRAKESFR